MRLKISETGLKRYEPTPNNLVCRLKMQNQCSEIRIRCERRSGELLKESTRVVNPLWFHNTTIGRLELVLVSPNLLVGRLFREFLRLHLNNDWKILKKGDFTPPISGLYRKSFGQVPRSENVFSRLQIVVRL